MGCLSSKPTSTVLDVPANDGTYDKQEYEDLLYLARVRAVKVTVNKATMAGLVAGLCVMAGVVVAGPVGAAAGGAVGTAVAMRHAEGVLTLTKLLEDTPPKKRGEVCKIFAEALKEEFEETIRSNPELKVIMGAGSPVHVVRYMVERDIIKNDQMKRMDTILSKIS